MQTNFEGRIRTTRNAAEVRAGKRDWFRFEAKGADETAIYIYDEISWFGIMASQFVSELQAVKTPRIALHISSPGGDVFDGIAIYNALKQHSAQVNVTVDSIAASIASVIAMAGDTVTMSKGSMAMIHEPFAMVIGDSRDMKKAAESLDLMGDSIAGIYAARAGGSVGYWRGLMAEETWFDAEQAVEAGLADEVAGEAAKNAFDLSIFRNAPRAGERKPAPETKPGERDNGSAEDRDWRKAARHAIAAAELEVA